MSATELVEHHLARIATLNPALNAVVTLDADGARRAARVADAMVTDGRPLGPLHGVPITVKDLFEVAGLRATFGYSGTRDHVARTDATVVARLRAAGAIVLGLTNVPELGFDWQCESPIFGRTGNPWDPARTPGGSSGGAAASVAAGLAALEIGSDAGGSIRIPAHDCGIYGFKPTEGRVSAAGHSPVPGLPRGLRHLVSFGPLARSVDDLALAYGIIAGPDPRDPEIPPVPSRAVSRGSAWRVAWSDDLGLPLGAATRDAVRGAAARLAAHGMQVVRAAPPDFDMQLAIETWGQIGGPEMGGAAPNALLPLLFRLLAARRYGDNPFSRGLKRGLAGGVGALARALDTRDQLIAALERFLGAHDAWLLPTAAVPAFSHQRSGAPIDVDGAPVSYAMAAAAWALPFSVTGHPAVVLPAATDPRGLPIGLQLVGRRWDDDLLLALAADADAALDAWRPSPTLLRDA